MATRELSLFADINQGRLVQSYFSTLEAILPRFVFGDSIPISFQPLKPAQGGSLPWSQLDLTGKTVRIAIGNPAGSASSGTFTLTYGANTTAAIAYNADGATIQAALNALASITSAGGVVVTRASTGAFRIVFNTAGARTAITSDTSALYPSSGAEIRVAVDGDGSKREIVVVRIETSPAAYAELTEDISAEGVFAPFSIVTEATVDTGQIHKLSFESLLPLGGTYQIQTPDLFVTPGIAYDGDAAEIQAALRTITGSTTSFAEVVVIGDYPNFLIQLAPGQTVGEGLNFGFYGDALLFPSGRKGVLNTNTASFIEILNGAQQATAKLEIELLDDVDGTTWTVYQGSCTIIDDVIGNTPSAETGGPSYPTVSMVYSMFQISGEGAGAHSIVLNQSGGSSASFTMFADSGFGAMIFPPIGYSANRLLELPDADGVLSSLRSFVDQTAANAVVSVGDAWWDATLLKARVRLS